MLTESVLSVYKICNTLLHAEYIIWTQVLYRYTIRLNMADLLKTWPDVEVGDSIRFLPAKRFTSAEIYC
jgi:hypothetical protein